MRERCRTSRTNPRRVIKWLLRAASAEIGTVEQKRDAGDGRVMGDMGDGSWTFRIVDVESSCTGAAVLVWGIGVEYAVCEVVRNA